MTESPLNLLREEYFFNTRSSDYKTLKPKIPVGCENYWEFSPVRILPVLSMFILDRTREKKNKTV